MIAATPPRLLDLQSAAITVPSGAFADITGSNRRAQAMSQLLTEMEAAGLRLYDYICGNPRLSSFPIGQVAPIERVISLNKGRIAAYSKASCIGEPEIEDLIRLAAAHVWDADRLCHETDLYWPAHERVQFSRDTWINRLTTGHHLLRTLSGIDAIARNLDNADRDDVAVYGVEMMLKARTPPAPPALPDILDGIDESLQMDPVAVAARVLRIIIETPDMYGLVPVSIVPYLDTPAALPLTLRCGIRTAMLLPEDAIWTDLSCARHGREEDPVALFSGCTPQTRYAQLLDDSTIEIDGLLYLYELLGQYSKRLQARQKHGARADVGWEPRARMISEIEAAVAVINLVAEII